MSAIPPQLIALSSVQEIAAAQEKIVSQESRKVHYQCEGIKAHGLHLVFRTKNQDALFYRVTLTKEGGKRGIAIDSRQTEGMRLFLAQNELPDRGWGSDCQCHNGAGLIHYYTRDPEICTKLYKILLKNHSFELTNITQAEWEDFIQFQ